MNRRRFLGGLFGVAGGLVLPEPARVRAYSFMPGRNPCGPFVHVLPDMIICRPHEAETARRLLQSVVDDIYAKDFTTVPAGVRVEWDVGNRRETNGDAI